MIQVNEQDATVVVMPHDPRSLSYVVQNGVVHYIVEHGQEMQFVKHAQSARARRLREVAVKQVGTGTK